jgi:hypothetical protein
MASTDGHLPPPAPARRSVLPQGRGTAREWDPRRTDEVEFTVRRGSHDPAERPTEGLPPLD